MSNDFSYWLSLFFLFSAAMVELAVGAGVKPKDPMYKDDPVFKDMK